MDLPVYIVDAFTGKLFCGNPAAVCPLNEWLDDKLMLNIAAENNLSETAFFVKEGNKYHIRWFTPVEEVDLCGHATLASSFVYFNFINKTADKVTFTSITGELVVEKEGNLISLNFPAQKPAVNPSPETALLKAFDVSPVKILKGIKNMLVFETEEAIRNMKPDINMLKDVSGDGVIITAQGNSVDFVSRFFAPNCGIDEDPVTGSAHTHLIPFWSERLNKKKMNALQVSTRGGELFCEDLGERVKISGRAVLYSQGKIYI